MPLAKPKSPPNKTELPEALAQIRALEKRIAGVIGEMQEKVIQLEQLNRFSGMLNSTLNPLEVREKALKATCELLQCETASILLIDPEQNELYWETALGEIGQELKRTLRLPINDQSIAGYVARTGKSVLIADLAKDPRHLKHDFTKKNRNMICVPLKTRMRMVGVLQALNKTPHSGPPDFTQDDLAILETLSHQVAIAIENSNLYADIKNNFYETVEALSEAIEKKDRYTGGHTKRVVLYSLCIAKYLNCSPDEMDQIKLGALLHDVGKIGIEDHILKKEAPLNADEWKVMQKHPDLGFDILRRAKGLQPVMDAMRFHHEKWDGTGYPHGLKGEAIPRVARIIAVADTYDAMVSTRPYRKGLPPETAFEEILRHRGTQFDPEVVDAFVQAFRRDKMGRSSGKKTEAAPNPLLSNCD